MSPAAILSPVFVQAALTLALLLASGLARVRTMKAGQVRMKDMALGQDVWPARVTQLGRAYQNQVEAPTLFYAVVALALATNLTDRVFLFLEWAFALARLAHAYVHVTSNYVPTRFWAFAAGIGALVALWVWLALRAFALV